MRISDWSSDVCSSDLGRVRRPMLFRGPVWGHLHVEGLFDDRRAPIVADTRWGTLSPRGSRSASFSAELPTTDPLEIKRVRIEYRDERERKSVGWGKSVSVRVDLGGSGKMKKQKISNETR